MTSMAMRKWIRYFGGRNLSNWNGGCFFSIKLHGWKSPKPLFRMMTWYRVSNPQLILPAIAMALAVLLDRSWTGSTPQSFAWNKLLSFPSKNLFLFSYHLCWFCLNQWLPWQWEREIRYLGGRKLSNQNSGCFFTTKLHGWKNTQTLVDDDDLM